MTALKTNGCDVGTDQRVLGNVISQGRISATQGKQKSPEGFLLGPDEVYETLLGHLRQVI